MSLKQQIDEDLKAAMLSGDKTLVTTLRGLKSAIQYAEVAKVGQSGGLSDDDIVTVLSKEAKKRQESADLYQQGGSPERAEAELTEKVVIERYLPAQMDEDELKKVVDEVVNQIGAHDVKQMGQVIGQVKQRVGVAADGALIAKLVKERLSA